MRPVAVTVIPPVQTEVKVVLPRRRAEIAPAAVTVEVVPVKAIKATLALFTLTD